MSENTTWICNLKDYDLPVIANSEEEAIKWLTNWNDINLDGEGDISEKVVETFSFFDKIDKNITRIYLTTEDFDREDPYGVAILCDYQDTMKDLAGIVKSKVKAFSPILGSDQKVNEENGRFSTFHTLRIKLSRTVANPEALSPFDVARTYTGNPPTENRLSIQILKQTPEANVELNTQKDLYDWLFSNIDIKTKIVEERNDPKYFDTTPNLIKVCSSEIGMCSRRGPGNNVIVGKNVLSSLQPVLTNKKINDDYIYDDYNYVGSYDCMDVYTLKDDTIIPDDMYIITYSMQYIDKGLFAIDASNGKRYLEILEDDKDCLGNYKDFIRIVRLVK